MATGDVDDMRSRLRSVLPPWFPDPDSSSIVDALLTGFATTAAFIYSLYLFAAQQTRLATSSGAWVDLWGWDFLGGRVLRRLYESDAAWRARIVREIFRHRPTRAGMIGILTDLTGRAPIIFEPTRPADTGGYNRPGVLAYNIGGGYGSLLLPFQCFVTAFRPSTSGIPRLSGYNMPAGGYGVPSRLSYGTLSSIVGEVTDADIYAAVASVKPAGTIPWTSIQS